MYRPRGIWHDGPKEHFGAEWMTPYELNHGCFDDTETESEFGELGIDEVHSLNEQGQSPADVANAAAVSTGPDTFGEDTATNPGADMMAAAVEAEALFDRGSQGFGSVTGAGPGMNENDLADMEAGALFSPAFNLANDAAYNAVFDRGSHALTAADLAAVPQNHGQTPGALATTTSAYQNDTALAQNHGQTPAVEAAQPLAVEAVAPQSFNLGAMLNAAELLSEETDSLTLGELEAMIEGPTMAQLNDQFDAFAALLNDPSSPNQPAALDSLVEATQAMPGVNVNSIVGNIQNSMRGQNAFGQMSPAEIASLIASSPISLNNHAIKGDPTFGMFDPNAMDPEDVLASLSPLSAQLAGPEAAFNSLDAAKGEQASAISSGLHALGGVTNTQVGVDPETGLFNTFVAPDVAGIINTVGSLAPGNIGSLVNMLTSVAKGQGPLDTITNAIPFVGPIKGAFGYDFQERGNNHFNNALNMQPYQGTPPAPLAGLLKGN